MSKSNGKKPVPPPVPLRPENHNAELIRMSVYYAFLLIIIVVVALFLKSMIRMVIDYKTQGEPRPAVEEVSGVPMTGILEPIPVLRHGTKENTGDIISWVAAKGRCAGCGEFEKVKWAGDVQYKCMSCTHYHSFPIVFEGGD